MDYITLPKMAEELGVTRITAWRWCRQKKFPAVQLVRNGIWFVRCADFEKFKAGVHQREDSGDDSK